MQSKVSMVMPCYNKAKYISEMFDSIIAQEWDNIELILVNDGSTDGTREVIAEYETRFRTRGFKVLVIDQENAGVCAAAKAGLERITGDYVCMVDADDELDPKYVSMMAGGLEENPEFDYTVCNFYRYTESGDEKKYTPSGLIVVESGCCDMTERYLLIRAFRAVWSYMVRVDYFRKCRIAENYDTTTMGTHEPSFMIPLTAYGGKVLSIDKPLYHFNISDMVSHSRPATYDKIYTHFQTTLELQRRAIVLLPRNVADDTAKKRFLTAANLCFLKQCVSNKHHFGGEEIKTQLTEDVYTFLSDSGLLHVPLAKEKVSGYEKPFLQAAECNFIGEQGISPPHLNGRVIGYGAMGKAAKNLLPLLKGTRFEPTELWDANGDGVNVKRPHFEVLNKNDTLFVFPIGKIEDELRRAFAEAPFQIFYNSEICRFLINEL